MPYSIATVAMLPTMRCGIGVIRVSPWLQRAPDGSPVLLQV